MRSRKRVALGAGEGAQRRFVLLLVPDAGIGLAGFAGAGGQDHAVQQRHPEPARRFNDAAVGEELGEIAAHGGIVRAVRRAEIDEENADLAAQNFWMAVRQRAGFLGVG